MQLPSPPPLLRWFLFSWQPSSSLTQDPAALPTLSLDRIEEGKLVLVEALKGAVPQSGDRQWLQVQQLSWWRVLLWKDQMSEGHRQLCLTG